MVRLGGSGFRFWDRAGLVVVLEEAGSDGVAD